MTYFAACWATTFCILGHTVLGWLLIHLNTSHPNGVIHGAEYEHIYAWFVPQSMHNINNFGTRAFNHLNHAFLHLCTAFRHHLGCYAFFSTIYGCKYMFGKVLLSGI
jgi:hypothetical protein